MSNVFTKRYVGKFLIGVDAQPLENLQSWADRGVNTAVRADLQGTKTIVQWQAAAVAAGLKTIREAAGPQFDLIDPTLLAVAMPDEADTSNHWYGVAPAGGWPAGVKVWATVHAPDGRVLDQVGRDYGPVDPITKTQKQTGASWQVTAEAYRIKAEQLRAGRPGIPLWGNFAGNYVTQNDPRPQYAAFCAALDVSGNDWHVIDKDPTPPLLPRRYQYWWPGWAAQRLTDYSGGKPATAYIECSNQNREPGRRWPTDNELWVEVWAAIAQGAAGIIYFPQKWGPFFADGVGATAGNLYPGADVKSGTAILNRIIEINALIAKANDFLVNGEYALQKGTPGVFLASWSLAGKRFTVSVNATNAAADINGVTLPACSAGVTIPAVPVETPPPGMVTRAEFDTFAKTLADGVDSAHDAAQGARAAATDAQARIIDAAAAFRKMATTLNAMAAALEGDAPPAPATEANAASGKG